MATTTWTSVLISSTDANFRDWGSKLSAGLAAIGMVKTSDTGQINWSTVTAPTATNTQQGYEVWQFNDALQSTAPIYLRIGFGSGSSANTPSLWITIGKGSDGAGAITGVLQAALQCGPNQSSAATWTSYASSADGAALAFSLAPAGIGTSTAGLFLVERSRTSDGAATGTGVMFVYPPTPITRCYVYSSGLVASINWFPVGLPVSSGIDSSLALSGSAPVYPGTVYTNGYLWQPRSVVVGMRADVGSYGVITVPGFGTFLSLGPAGQKMDQNAGQYSCACMVWS